ncbi:uncharacterized protein LOC131213497 [Anopheles bellator]|uniref:uncharacterized protein LOC131213497 n=1 Tax=Anopheles bellator TaxID=139047 RepID=UPI002647AFBE|nr:uncharacterized protein LOC131213497 [Anopheles bellator]
MWQRVGLVVLLLLLTLSAPSPVLARAIPGEELDQATENNEIDHGHEPLTSSTTRMESETTTGRTTTAATTSTSTTTSTTEGLPTFNRNQVSLDLPSDLFTSTANLTLRLRNVVSELITRTSVRIAQVVRFLQPVFGYHLMIDIPKELDV